MGKAYLSRVAFAHRDTHPAIVDRQLLELCRQRRDGKIESLEQRGQDPRKVSHGKTWRGQRSRFVLSGILTCARCGNRYQGFHRQKGQRRWGQAKVKTYAYGCGGYITKGTAVCSMGPIPQETLETAVIDAVLEYYSQYEGEQGTRALAEAVKAQLGREEESLRAAKERLEADEQHVRERIDYLLDHLSPDSREIVEEKLKELKAQRDALTSRREELERLELGQAAITNVVEEAASFLATLLGVLREGLAQEKLVVLRKCVERVWIDADKGAIKLAMRVVPASATPARETIEASGFASGATLQGDASPDGDEQGPALRATD